MFNPHFEKGYQMVQTIVNKHKDELNWATFDYVTVELVASNGDIIEQLVPKLVLDFKRYY